MNCSGERHAARAERFAQRAERVAAEADLRRRRREERWSSRESPGKALARARRQADRRTNHQVLGAVLLAIGGNWLLAELELFPFGWAGLLAVGLITLGVSMMATPKSGRTMPLVVVGFAMTVLLAMSSGDSGLLQTGDVKNIPELTEIRELLEKIGDNG